MKRLIALTALAAFAFAPAKDLAPNKTHAVLNISYTNFDDVPQKNKTLTFVGKKNPQNKVTVKTNGYGEVSFLIPREDSYQILCESLTGPFECGETPYVSPRASYGSVNVAFDDTRAELQGVSFKAGSAELVPSTLATLDKTIAGLKKNAKAKVEIEGHTSSEGGEEYNQKLSEDRANSVRDYMIRKGISKDRVTAVGYGYSRPKASNDTEEGRKQNRRIEVRVTNPEEVDASPAE
ncbi:MAG: OmpA family protein [Fibrobacter sp.]|nr:OmpA family protein [Fibrobacter sp.]